MLKKWGLRGLLSIVLILLVLFYTIPAKLIQKQINEGNQKVNIKQAIGRITKGEFDTIQVNGQQIDKLSWDLQLTKLLIGEISAHITVFDPKGTGSFTVTQKLAGETLISKINLKQEASALSDIHPAFKVIAPDGEIKWSDVALSFNEESFVSAEGLIIWADASLYVNRQDIILGDIYAKPTVDDSELVIQLTSNEVLDLQGNLRIKMDETYLLEFSLKADLPQNIKNSVMLMSRLGADDRYHIKIPGHL